MERTKQLSFSRLRQYTSLGFSAFPFLWINYEEYVNK